MIYFDNAATTHLPDEVIWAMYEFEKGGRGNPYRGLHKFAEKATVEMEKSRLVIASFFGVKCDEIIFTKSATDGLNLALVNLVRGLGVDHEVVYTIFDHHSTLLPLIELSKIQGFKLRLIGSTDHGELDLVAANNLINNKTRLVVAPHVSNVTGFILPVKELVELAHGVGARVLIDGAQAVGHMLVDILNLGVDAYAWSAHKMYGPMGIGGLYVKKDVMDGWMPMLYGGGMVEEVDDFGNARYLTGQRLFEAGTPNVTGVIGLAAACNFLQKKDICSIRSHEEMLKKYLLDGLIKIPGVHIFNESVSENSLGILSFAIKGKHPHDVAQFLSDSGIAVRAGYHCAAPFVKGLHEHGVVRVSFNFSNKKEEIDFLLEKLQFID